MRFLILCFFIHITVVSQKRYTLYVENFEALDHVVHFNAFHRDSLSVLKELLVLQNDAMKRGYLTASIDTIKWKNDSVVAQIYFGQKFQTALISTDIKDKAIVSKFTRFNERSLLRLPISKDLLSSTMLSIVTKLNNEGFPFAKVYFKNILFDNAKINADLVIDRGVAVRWKTLEIKGDAKISLKLLASLLNIKDGDLFSLLDLEKANARLRQLPYISLIKPCELLLTKSHATLYVYLKNAPVSLINGILGLQQRPTDFKIQFTGDLRIKLQNAFKKGELIDVNWRSIQPLSQQLKLQTTLPFLFRTNFGIDASFELFKRDTSFLELKTNLGILYQLKSNIRLKAFYKRYSSNVLRAVNNDPNFVSVQTNNYGLQLFSQQLNYLPSPTKGYLFSLEASAGLRKFKPIDSLIVKKFNTFTIQFNYQKYISLSNRNVLKLAVFGESYLSPSIFVNEALRFGGQNTQRGFNEDILLSTTRATCTIEYRFLLDKNSYLFGFYDQSWYEKNIKSYYKDTPTGFGLGLTFGTNVGVFSISYAMGKQKTSELLLKNGKIHFGYVAFF
jgi:outer membrane protein assembly factor BamA